MAEFDPITVTPPAIVVHDREIARRLTFIANDSGDLESVELVYDKYKNDGSILPIGDTLRQSTGALAFLTSFKANPKQAVNDWLVAKTNELD